MRVQQMIVTPFMADEFIKDSFNGQRQINKSIVKNYSEMMIRGRWGYSDSMICLNSNGIMLNGYHRMSAVVLSGETVEFTVALDMSDDNFRNMDQQRKRSQLDVAKFEGLEVTKPMLHMINLMIKMKYSRIKMGDMDYVKSCFDFHKEAFVSLKITNAKCYDVAIQLALVIGIHEGRISLERAREFSSCMSMPTSKEDWAAAAYKGYRIRIGNSQSNSMACFRVAQKAVRDFSRRKVVKSYRDTDSNIFLVNWSL